MLAVFILTFIFSCGRGRSGGCSSGRFHGVVVDSARVSKYRVGREGVVAAAGACHCDDMGAVRGQAPVREHRIHLLLQRRLVRLTWWLLRLLPRKR